MPKPLDEQVVVITGASQGIGRETALQFAMRGASVVVAARNEEGLRELTRQVERLGGQRVVRQPPPQSPHAGPLGRAVAAASSILRS